MDPTKKELYTAKRSSGLDISSPEVTAAIEKLKDDRDSTNWVLLKVVNSCLGLHSSGSSGLVELLSSLDDDDVYYGGFRCLAGDKVKFYHLYFVGQNVGGMKKGKASMYKSGVLGLIDAHGEISCVSGLEDISESFVAAEVGKLSGSSDLKWI